MIFLASDHGGYELKEILKQELAQKGLEFRDLGTDNPDKSVDYPQFAHKLAEQVVTASSNLGILVCGSGIGVSMAANRHCGVRAALCHSLETTALSRRHNDANVLCLGGRVLDHQLAIEMLHQFLSTDFDGGRHQKRIDQLDNCGG